MNSIEECHERVTHLLADYRDGYISSLEHTSLALEVLLRDTYKLPNIADYLDRLPIDLIRAMYEFTDKLRKEDFNYRQFTVGMPNQNPRLEDKSKLRFIHENCLKKLESTS